MLLLLERADCERRGGPGSGGTEGGEGGGGVGEGAASVTSMFADPGDSIVGGSGGSACISSNASGGGANTEIDGACSRPRRGAASDASKCLVARAPSPGINDSARSTPAAAALAVASPLSLRSAVDARERLVDANKWRAMSAAVSRPGTQMEACRSRAVAACSETSAVESRPDAQNDACRSRVAAAATEIGGGGAGAKAWVSSDSRRGPASLLAVLQRGALLRLLECGVSMLERGESTLNPSSALDSLARTELPSADALVKASEEPSP